LRRVVVIAVVFVIVVLGVPGPVLVIAAVGVPVAGPVLVIVLVMVAVTGQLECEEADSRRDQQRPDDRGLRMLDSGAELQPDRDHDTAED
jgi:hypothetical protein